MSPRQTPVTALANAGAQPGPRESGQDEMPEPEPADYYYAHRDAPEMVGAQVDYVPLGPQGWRRG